MQSDEFRRITDVFPDAAILLAKEGTILAVNRNVASVGLAPDQATGKNLAEFTASSVDALRDYLRQCSRTSEPVVGTIELRDAAGRVYACRAYGTALPACEPGGPVQIVLRLLVRENAPSQFAVLNQKIRELSEEIRRRQDIEKVLREQEQWLRVTLSSIGDAVITTDAEGRVTFLNPVAEELTGWTTASAQAQPLDEVFRIVSEETRLPVESPVAKVLKEGAIVGLANHSVLIARSGSERPIDDSAAPIRDASGRVGGVVLVFRDNSEQRRAGEDLRKSRRLLLSVLDNTPAAIFLKERSGRILLVNRRFCRLVGRPSHEILGRTDTDVFGAWFDDASRANDELVFQSGQPMEFVERLKLPEGVQTFLVQKAPIDGLGDEGRVLVGIGTNVTEREQNREAITRLLDREKQQTRRLVQLATASLRIHSALSVEDVLKVTTAEAERLIGAHQAIGYVRAIAPEERSLTSAHLSDKYAQWREHLVEPRPASDAIYEMVCRRNRAVRISREEMQRQAEWHQFGAEGPNSPPLLGWLAAPFVGRDGTNLGLLQLSDKAEGEFTDDDLSILQQLASLAAVAIENARLYQELRAADRRKDEFLAMLAHELRNPLAPVRNAVMLLGMDGLDAETSRQAREIIDRQVDHLVRLVDDLLDVSRIMRGKIELRTEPIEARVVVERALETARPLIDAQRHQLTVNVADEPIWIEADLVRLAQVVGNLLNNAAKYTEPGGHVWLTMAKVDGGVEFRVRDTGVGIEPTLLSRVFELFTQASRSIERSQGGLGIGLTLVRSLVEMHGGQVTARSDGAGQGSEFVVSLPTIAPDRPDPQPANNPGEATRPLRILVVEDIVGSAKMMATMLHKIWKHDVRMAHDGLEALEVARDFRPELVLLDIGLPQIDGYEVARRLRAQPATKDAVLVALTGYGTQEDRHRSQEAGFDEHLVKPASVDRLQELFRHPRLAD